jgi:BirA family biotin operon repressor/biotin-[acetyl-CoA-carboxylase] ligase
LSGFKLPVTWVPHWVGLSLVEALRNLSLATDDLRLKWPNDLYFKREFKVAGILCEKVEQGVIAGIGVNIQSHSNLPDRKSTSLQNEFSGSVVAGFSKMLLSEVVRVMANEPALSILKQRYLEHSLYQAGDQLKWVDPATQVAGEGQLVGIGDHGELLVRVSDRGTSRTLPLFGEEITGVALR